MPNVQRLTGDRAAWRTDFYRRLGRRIRTARKRHGVSQRDLALATGFMENSSICRIERGTQQADAHLVLAIADAIGVPVSTLYPRCGKHAKAS